jgi:hypothetical protein
VLLYMLSMGLMIHFRRPHTNIGVHGHVPILIAFPGSTMILCLQIAVMAAAEQEQIAAVLIRLGPLGYSYMDRAVSNSICGAIWTNSLPGALQRLLPENLEPDLRRLDRAAGAIRWAILGTRPFWKVYGIAQRMMLIASTSVMGLAFSFVLMIRNINIYINISKNAQVKGILF